MAFRTRSAPPYLLILVLIHFRPTGGKTKIESITIPFLVQWL